MTRNDRATTDRHAPRPALRRPVRLALTILVSILAPVVARAGEDVVTTLADFEDDSVATTITTAYHALAADCTAERAAIPARGQRSLMVAIGATERGAWATCDLRFRAATFFDQADRIATYAWITKGSAEIQFRIRDGDGTVFETPRMPVSARNRWVRLVAELGSRKLRPAGGGAQNQPPRPVVWPIEVLGYRIHTNTVGRQTVFLDDLEVEHRVTGSAVLRGEFLLDRPTHLYEPGDVVYAAVMLENTSERESLPLSVKLAWLRADGTVLTTGRSSLSLPARGRDFRSRQAVDFSQQVPAPGLYQLVATVRAPGWLLPAVFKTTVAAVVSNRALPRGRSTFFGVRSNLMRESPADRVLEILIAREAGVQVLALDTSWQALEPQPERFELDELGRVIDAITSRDIAVMLVLGDPPNWLPSGGREAWDRQVELCAYLAGHFGARVVAYQPMRLPASRTGGFSSEEVAALVRLRDRVRAERPEAGIVSPALRIGAGNIPPWPEGLPADGIELALATEGNAAAARRAIDTFVRRSGHKDEQHVRWFHEGEPIDGPGTRTDAVAILRHYVEAARHGTAGVVWFDLRDDRADPRHPERMRGLVRRDFSPRTTLLGLANTIGMLQGLLYAGPVPGTPAAFDSALYLGGEQQVAVFFPRPNRVLPAIVTPYTVVSAGVLDVFDIARREQPLLVTPFSTLVAVRAEPFFVTLGADRTLAKPALGVAQPWLRLPAVVPCDREATLPIEIDALGPLRRSYLQIKLPPNAPVRSSLTSRGLQAAAGDTLRFDVKLTRTATGPFEPATLTVRLSLEGQAIEVPVTLRPLYRVLPTRTGGRIDQPAYRLGDLHTGEPGTPGANLFAAYEKRKLRLAVELPADLGPRADLHLSVAAAGQDPTVTARVALEDTRVQLGPANGTDARGLRGWRCRVGGEDGRRTLQVTIPARSLGLEKLTAGQRLLLSMRLVAPANETRRAPLILCWREGYGGDARTDIPQWIELQPKK